jgi:O-antigen ligase
VVIGGGLINSSCFYDPTYTAYYAFVLSAIVFTLTITPPHFYLTDNKVFIFNFPQIFLGIWCLYLLGQYLNDTASTLFFFYIVLHFLLLQSTVKLFSIHNFNFKHICYGIVVIATLESLYCSAQYFGNFKSQNEFFAVTGSCVNPNVIAQFLAITIPVFLYLLQFKYKKIILSSLGIVVIALLLLKCRSAHIATIVAILIYYCLEYDFIKWIRNAKNKSSAKSLFIVFLLIVIPTVSHLYNSKKASADGRQFIWKLSTIMATQKPLTGYGYGSFEKEYNLYQADYIAEGNATLDDKPLLVPLLWLIMKLFKISLREESSDYY